MGFLSNLFGGGGQQKREAYFLNEDDSKTFGNLDYMRTSKAVRRTYPKTTLAKVKENLEEQTKIVSATKIGSMVENLIQSSPTPSTSSQPATPTFQGSKASSDRRKVDTSMDMFRNLAKDIRR
jgi:hypothetical protein